MVQASYPPRLACQPTSSPRIKVNQVCAADLTVGRDLVLGLFLLDVGLGGGAEFIVDGERLLLGVDTRVQEPLQGQPGVPGVARRPCTARRAPPGPGPASGGIDAR